MPELPVETVELEDLRVDAFVEEDVLIRFQGVMREQNPEDWLCPFLGRVSDVSWNRPKIVVDLVSLSFMNATAFRVMLPWLKEIGSRQPPCNVVVRIKDGIMWQEVAVSALKSIAGNMITSEVVY